MREGLTVSGKANAGGAGTSTRKPGAGARPTSTFGALGTATRAAELAAEFNGVDIASVEEKKKRRGGKLVPSSCRREAYNLSKHTDRIAWRVNANGP